MKILLFEDDPSTSEFLTETLTAHHYAVDAIADGAVGLAMANRGPYDLMIVDLMLPSLNGLEVCQRLRAQGDRTPILILTVRANNADIVAGLDAGADDYLVKSCEASQLLARVRALLRRSHRTAQPILQWGDLRLDPALAQVTYSHQPITCRPKEYELLELFLRYPHRLLTRSAIIDHLWPLEESPVEGSVTNLVKDLRQRLKLAGLPESPIETVYGLGYRLKPLPQEDCPTPANLADGGDRPLSLTVTLERATQRFQATLEERLATLDGAVRSLQAGTFSPQQQQGAWAEAHKLAGGLGLFGHDQASHVAEAIEELLRQADRGGPHLASQLSQYLVELERALATPAAPGVGGQSGRSQW